MIGNAAAVGLVALAAAASAQTVPVRTVLHEGRPVDTCGADLFRGRSLVVNHPICANPEDDGSIVVAVNDGTDSRINNLVRWRDGCWSEENITFVDAHRLCAQRSLLGQDRNTVTPNGPRVLVSHPWLPDRAVEYPLAPTILGAPLPGIQPILVRADGAVILGWNHMDALLLSRHDRQLAPLPQAVSQLFYQHRRAVPPRVPLTGQLLSAGLLIHPYMQGRHPALVQLDDGTARVLDDVSADEVQACDDAVGNDYVVARDNTTDTSTLFRIESDRTTELTSLGNARGLLTCLRSGGIAFIEPDASEVILWSERREVRGILERPVGWGVIPSHVDRWTPLTTGRSLYLLDLGALVPALRLSNRRREWPVDEGRPPPVQPQSEPSRSSSEPRRPR